MGTISFLTDKSHTSEPSITESIYKLKNNSLIFKHAWNETPPDVFSAARESVEAMAHLDHIVNEIMRCRDHMQSANTYAGSGLQTQLDTDSALSVDPVTREQQNALSELGPGNGVLPSPGSSISMEKLLNKIKHRRPDSANFRIEISGNHVFLIGVDKPNRTPDSIVEFVITDFCHRCNEIAKIM
jgi:hypothetical protein